MNYTDEQIKKALEKILNYLEKEKALAEVKGIEI